MAKAFTLLLCLLFLGSVCLGSSNRFNKCQRNRLSALEPYHRVESEGGFIETWNSKHPDLECAGVAVSKCTLFTNGLHLPSYSPYARLILIVQGKGALGLSIPGCPETFEEPARETRRGSSRPQQPEDSHQKIRELNEGVVVLIPPGVPYWTYNTGNEPLVGISLLHTSSLDNQLDQSPRVFYLAGNPDLEHLSESLKQQKEAGGSVLGGFSKQFLSKSFSTSEYIAEKLESLHDDRKQIVKVKEGLSVIGPKWQQGGEEEHIPCPPRQPSHEHEHEHEHEEEVEPRSHRPLRPRSPQEEEVEPRHTEEEVVERKEDEAGHERRERRWRKTKTKTRPCEPEEVKEEVEEVEEEKRERGAGNGLEETLCTLKLEENIARPSSADFYNPRAGRITTLNSLTLPALSLFGLSAQYVVLYKNGIYAPHWNLNANSVIYVIRGQGKVTVVNSEGKAVYNEDLKRGQLLVVPQNFVVAEEAGEQGFEFVIFKTNHRAITSYLKEAFRAMPSEVLANAYNLLQRQVHDLKFQGNLGPLVNPDSWHSLA
ncbi:Glycinin G4, partial [Mucuna pruriens]